MNVDLLCEFASLNGGENSILALLPALRRRAVEVRVVAPPEGPLADAVRSLGIELVAHDIVSGDSGSRKAEKLERVLKDSHADLLHANSLSMGRISGAVGNALRKPAAAHFRDIIRLNDNAVRELNRNRRLFAVSEATRSFHLAQGIDPKRCFVLYNGIDTQRFRPSPPTGDLHREFGIAPEAELLAVIGQVGLRKGQDRLLESLRPIFERRRDIHLLMVGRRWSTKEESIRYESDLHATCDREPFRRRVHFCGVRDDIPRLLNELTLLVHPARQEPLGRVLLEAAACGVAVVATDVGGTREIFPDSRFDGPGDTGKGGARIVSPDSRTAFQEAVELLLDADAERKRLGSAARRRIEAAFTVEIAADSLYRHYEAVLEGK